MTLSLAAMSIMRPKINSPPSFMSQESSSELTAGEPMLKPEVKILAPSSIEVAKRKIDDSLTMNKLRFQELPLYGRQEEINSLKESVARIVSAESRLELILLSGDSGTGKTCLARYTKDVIQSASLKTRAAYIYGKFDHSLREEPYSAIASAFGEFCSGALETLGEEQTDRLRAAMREKLDSLDLHLLRSVLPCIDKIAPPSSEIENVDVDHIRSDDKRIRLQFAFQNFIHISTSIMSFVLFLDDLQWADESSLSLLAALASDEESRNLMMVLSYRSNELSHDSSLWKILKKISKISRETGLVLTKLGVGNLTVDQINDLLTDLFSASQAQTFPLAQRISSRTHGNPFFIKTFLSILYESQLIHFNVGSLQWRWNLGDIDQASVVTDNVADLIKHKLRKSKSEMVDMLLYAACLGTKFEKMYLSMIWHDCQKQKGKTRTADTLDTLINEAIEEQFLESTQDHYFRFVHDAVKDAAISMVPKREFESLQKNAGSILYKDGLDSRGSDQMIFVVANLLNQGHERSWDVATLNLRAAKRARDLSAFASAAAYATQGLTRLPDMWGEYDQAQLSVELHSIGAEAERCAGNVEEAKKHCSEVLRQDIPETDKMIARHVMIDILEHESQYQDALDYCLDSLDSIGCGFPRNSVTQSVATMTCLKKIKTADYMPQIGSVNKMEMMSDQLKCHAMDLMESVSSSAYNSGNPSLYFLAAARRARWTLKYGLHVCSPPAFAALAGVLMHTFGDWERGIQLAELSLRMIDRLKSKGAKFSTAATIFRANLFVYTWTKPPRTVLSGLMQSYRSGMLHGDIDAACKILLCYTYCELFAGKELNVVEENCKPFIVQMEGLRYHKWGETVRYLLQAILNLKGESSNTVTLTGTAVSEEEVLANPMDSFGRHHMVHFVKRFLCAFFGDFVEGAEDALKNHDDFMKKYPGMFLGMDPFYSAICLYSAARETRQAKYKKAAERIHQSLEVWVQKGAINHAHTLSILEAERAHLAGKNKSEVSKLYHKAIVRCVRGGFMQNSALAEELFTSYLLSVGEEFDALYHLTECIQRYSEWGATQKVVMLNQKYEKFLARKPSDFAPSGTNSRPRGWACIIRSPVS